MRIGYACQAIGVRNTQIRGCMLKNAAPERLLSLAAENFSALDRLIDYNLQNNIALFRISSDVVPFGSSLAAPLDWEAACAPTLNAIAQKIAASGMRVSMHPGQYTVLNSPDAAVARRAEEDLLYHARVLDALAPGAENKIILHIGGKYGDTPAAMRRFIGAYRALDSGIRRRLALENDGSVYTIAEVLSLCETVGAPAVYDNLHNTLNPAEPDASDALWIERTAPTWRLADGAQKLHYSQQHPEKTRGAHSDSIAVESFLDFCHGLPARELAIMLEVKDKNLSALKCMLCISPPRVSALEAEWARYIYAVLERSPEDYAAIRALFAAANGGIALPFYRLVERALSLPENAGRAVNALDHVWGYFRDIAAPAERTQYERRLAGYASGAAPLNSVKTLLRRLAEKYTVNYLLDSYYFDL